MGDNREVNPSGQELIEGSTIAGEISSVNQRTPPSAQSVKGRVRLSDDQRRESKTAADKRCNLKRKRNEDKMMEELKKLEEYSGKLEDESRDLKNQRNEMKARVDEQYNIIHSQLVDNYAGQNTEIGETSTGQDGLNEMNQAPNTSNADTIPGENASMNLQTPPRSAQPAGSSGLPDDKRARKSIADKKYREKRKRKLDEAAERTKELKEKNAKLELGNAVLKAEANLLGKQLGQLRDISKKMISKISQQENSFLGLTLPSFGIGDRGSTSFFEDMDYLMNLGIASHECHRQEKESVLEPPSHD